MQGNIKYVYVAYTVGALVLWMTLSRLLSSIAYLSGVSDPALLGSQFPLSSAIAFLVSVGGLIYVARNAKITQFGIDVVVELRKVTWPEWPETQRSTIVVIVTSLLIAFMLGFFDFVWAELTGLIYS